MVEHQLLREDERAGSFLKKPLFDLSVDITASGVDGTDRTVRRSPRFKEGEVIARRFSVIRLIARGGMGEVYEVEDHLLQCSRVALKIVRPEIAADPEASHRFMQEVYWPGRSAIPTCVRSTKSSAATKLRQHFCF